MSAEPSAKVEPVLGPIPSHIRPVREGERPERIVATNGWTVDLDGVLELCTEECDHTPEAIQLSEIP